MRWFNDKVLEKMISFSRRIKEINISFDSNSYIDIVKDINNNTLIYFDPPYSLTTGSYNDGKRGFKGWNNELEKELFNFADNLTKKNIPFILSYIFEHKGNKNENFKFWIEKNNYNIINLGEITGISGQKRKEVLVLNYDK